MQQPHAIFDRALLRARKRRAAKQFAGHDFLFREAAVRLVDRLDDVTHRFPLALEIGAHGDILGSALQGRGGIERLVQTSLAWPRAGGVMCDEELLPFADNSVDLVVSNLALHWVNDLPGVLVQIRRLLRPDGLFLAVLPGGQTLFELREAFDEAALACEGGISPRVSPFVDVRDGGSLLQRAGFALPVVDADRLTVSYEHVFALMRDLRGAGESNMLWARDRKPLRRDTLAAMVGIYEQKFRPDGRLQATFELVTLTAWKPHASQQKPAQRGSGKVNLGEVLS